MRNYVRANETRLTVSFTPQLRAKKRKLNSLTAQSPYISRTGAVRSNDPPFRHFIYSDKFPNFNGKTEPNFLIVSRPISISMTWNTSQKLFYDASVEFPRRQLFLLIVFFLVLFAFIHEINTFNSNSVRFFFWASLTIELRGGRNIDRTADNYPRILMENIFFHRADNRSRRHRVLSTEKTISWWKYQGLEEKIVPVPNYNALRYRFSLKKKKKK